MTDESIMLCVKNGELDKAAILYERYKKKLLRFFLYKNDKETGEDLVQQVFYRVIKFRQSYKPGSNFKAWIFSIAWNVQNHSYEQRKKMDSLKTNYDKSEGYTQVNDEHQAIQQALKLLGEPHCELILMSKFLGMSHEEIAQALGCSAGAVKTRIFRAMKSLREVYLKIS